MKLTKSRLSCFFSPATKPAQQLCPSCCLSLQANRKSRKRPVARCSKSSATRFAQREVKVNKGRLQEEIDYEAVVKLQYVDMIMNEVLRMYPAAVRLDVFSWLAEIM